MKKSRRKAREFVLKALYQWQLSGNAVSDIVRHLREEEGFDAVDEDYFRMLLEGVAREAGALDERLQPHLDRPAKNLSPIEHAILRMGAYEALHCPDVPYRVIINEAVELAKAYGGTDGHKYVNGVLDKLVGEVRGGEIERSSRRA